MTPAGGGVRDLIRDTYLLDLTLAIYRVYAARVDDAGGRGILEEYLRAESYRAVRIERRLETLGARAAPAVRALFRGAGGVYAAVTSRLGTRIMLRIALSASRRASRRACVALGAARDPDLLHIASLRAKNEGDLLAALRQHLIDTRPRRS